jgi:hypothetical protein
MMTKIRVAYHPLLDGDKPQRYEEEAEIVGPFGVHLSARRETHPWMVTHVKTGFGLKSFDDQKAARKFAKLLAVQRGWGFRSMAEFRERKVRLSAQVNAAMAKVGTR